KLVALGGPAKTVRVYSVADGKLLYELKKHTDWITAIEFSPDGSRLATGDRSGSIYLWESAAGGTVGALADHKDSITSLSWRGDGKPRGASPPNDALLTKVACSSDGKLVIAGDYAGKVVIWDGAKLTPLH